jgi:hypothetical protein
MDYRGSIGLIYMLTCDDPSLIYIGSTKQTKEQRLAGHLHSYKQWKRTGKNYISSCKLFEVGNVKIAILEEVPGCWHLHYREQYHINNYKCVNINSACGSYDFMKNLEMLKSRQKR